MDIIFQVRVILTVGVALVNVT